MKTKTIICIILICIGFSGIAQNNATLASMEKKVYKASFIMPDGTLQKVYLIASDRGKEEFLRVVQENVMQTKPVTLKSTSITGVHNLDKLPSVSENTAYRFLANELCESCGTSSTIHKTQSTIIVIDRPSGELKNILQIYWIPEFHSWAIRVTCPAGPQTPITFPTDKDNVLFF
jgi:hypothetical protein